MTVQAPSPTASVTFVSTLGTWDGTTSGVVTKTVVNGTISASLSSTLSGVANVQVYDAARQGQIAYTASRTISFTAAVTNAYKVTLQSTPSVVAPSSGGNASLATLVATVTDFSNNPVGGASVAFSILNPTGGGETINPPVILTAGIASPTTTLGQASTTFTAGSLPSGATGVQIRAKVVGTSISTNTSPSGNDATIVIGGTAGSVTIGTSTVIADTANSTVYTLPMSVLVADANGNPLTNTVVSLSTWPIAFNAGGNVCAPLDANNRSTQPGVFYYNEDFNENLVRDPGEIIGARLFYPSRAVSTSFPGGQPVDAAELGGGDIARHRYDKCKWGGDVRADVYEVECGLHLRSHPRSHARSRHRDAGTDHDPVARAQFGPGYAGHPELPARAVAVQLDDQRCPIAK